jgi:SAM-dependent methyltransferase
VARYDFNEPGSWRDLDTIFAVNALHCAKDKVRTLRHLRDMLRSGGTLLLGEGIPYSGERQTPWPLNGFFGLFRGWWDVGGFLTRDDWLAAIHAAGFQKAGWAARRAGSYDLGGVIWCER